MATIVKLSRTSGTAYKAVIRRRGHPLTSKTFSTRSAAERWARKYEAALEQDDAGLTTEAQRHTLADAIKRYRAEVLPGKAPETARKYEQHLLWWAPRVGHLHLSELAAPRIAAARDELAAAGKAPSTVNRYLATLASVLTACTKRWHWLSTSPLGNVSKPVERNAGTRFLTEDELGRLLQACRESESEHLLLAVLLSIGTGARQGEILGLRWADVDLQRGLIHLRVGNETLTKGGVRSVPIPAAALPLLKARKAARDAAPVVGLHDPGLLFPSRVSRKQPVQLRTPWETALRRAGIENFRWHDLRHSAASFLARSGASLLEIGAVLGHRSQNTSKRYSHLTEAHTHQLVRGVMDGLLGEGKE